MTLKKSRVSEREEMSYKVIVIMMKEGRGTGERDG